MASFPGHKAQKWPKGMTFRGGDLCPKHCFSVLQLNASPSLVQSSFFHAYIILKYGAIFYTYIHLCYLRFFVKYLSYW